MPATLPNVARSQEIPSIDSLRPKMAKAEPAVTASHTALRGVIAGVVKQAGKLESTARDMGIDRAQLYRQLENGHLTIERLEALPPEQLAELGKELIEQYGPLAASPSARLRMKARDLRDTADELDQLSEHIS